MKKFLKIIIGMMVILVFSACANKQEISTFKKSEIVGGNLEVSQVVEITHSGEYVENVRMNVVTPLPKDIKEEDKQSLIDRLNHKYVDKNGEYEGINVEIKITETTMDVIYNLEVEKVDLKRVLKIPTYEYLRRIKIFDRNGKNNDFETMKQILLDQSFQENVK